MTNRRTVGQMPTNTKRYKWKLLNPFPQRMHDAQMSGWYIKGYCGTPFPNLCMTLKEVVGSVRSESTQAHVKVLE